MMSLETGRALIVLVVLGLVNGAEKIWKYDSDLANPANWVNGKLGVDCEGIHFATTNTAPVYVKELTTSQLTLPRDGEVQLLEGGYIEFRNTKKCIQLKPIDYHPWFDHDSWSQSNNFAVPHKQRIPCTYDQVTFPKIIHSRVSENLTSTVTVGGLKFGTEQISGEDILRFGKTRVGRDIFFNPLGPFNFMIEDEKCEDPYGCLCHREFVPCPRTVVPTPNCLSPVLPEEFCTEICGAYITFVPGSGPNLQSLAKKLEQYTSDTHASRVKNYLGQEVVQVVFTEKEYTGDSLKEAQDFLEFLKSSKVDNPQLLQSGFYIYGGASSWSIVFGSFLAVSCFFVLILCLNNNSSLDTFLARLHQSRGSLFFARFDTTDEQLVLGNQSEAGSVLDITKSFDNPMYGHDAASTSTQQSEDVEE